MSKNKQKLGVLIEEIGGSTLIEQPPSKVISFTLHLIPQGTPWYNREGKLQHNPCILYKAFDITATTKPEELLEFLQQMLNHGTLMSGIDVISDPCGSYSVEDFCKMYSSIPVSLLTPPRYVLRPRTFNCASNSDMLKLIENKLSQLHNLSPVADRKEKMMQKLSLDYTHASCHIEGNPLSRLDTELVVTHCLSIDQNSNRNNKPSPSQTSSIGKPYLQLLDNLGHPVDLSTDVLLKELAEQPYSKQDFDEVKNHKRAVDDFLINPTRETQFNFELPKLIHKCLTDGILMTAGEYRTVDVRVSKSSFRNPSYEFVPQLMSKFMEEVNGRIGILHPVLLAAWAHDMLVRIHPFEDGNGRTARILMNTILVHFGYPISFWFEEMEDVYWSACELAHVGNDLSHINRIVCESVNYSMDIYLAAAKQN